MEYGLVRLYVGRQIQVSARIKLMEKLKDKALSE